MTKKERFDNVLAQFQSDNPTPETELNYSNPYQLLVAVILSAQCTDKRVNAVTPALFAQFPTPQHLAFADAAAVFPYIRSISYPNNKAQHLVGMAKVLLNDFDGIVPSSLQDLMRMPGVGRKTANVIASVVYNKPTMAVDTHVFRVAARIGLVTNATTPLATEKQLLKYIPVQLVAKAHHWIILHGRYICIARSPKCESCSINNYCKFYSAHYGKK